MASAEGCESAVLLLQVLETRADAAFARNLALPVALGALEVSWAGRCWISCISSPQFYKW